MSAVKGNVSAEASDRAPQKKKVWHRYELDLKSEESSVKAVMAWLHVSHLVSFLAKSWRAGDTVKPFMWQGQPSREFL